MRARVETTIELIRTITIPDKIKIERYRRVPELGPKILFFSGGTAIKNTSKKIITYTHNSIHIITPFDSGGSSAKIRDSFRMISVGDLRNRLMALADQSVKGNHDIYKLFSYRLPENLENEELINKLYEIILGKDQLIAAIPDPMKGIISNHLRYFVNKMPLDFNLKGANIGNLILTGGYLNNDYNIASVLYIFSRLIEARGTVKPVVNSFLHLAAELENGTLLVGQHKLTGKEMEPIQSPVKNVYLADNLTSPVPVKCPINTDVISLIKKAEIICYPMGSFYSSIIANLIPDGVGEAVAANNCPKIYIPNTAKDPEQLGMDLTKAVTIICNALIKDNSELKPNQVLNYILIDTENAKYAFDINIQEIEKMSIKVVNTALVTQASFPYIDPELLIQTLLSLT